MKPGQYRVFIIGWKTMIVSSLITTAFCFLSGWWLGKTQTDNLRAEINSLKKSVQTDISNVHTNLKAAGTLVEKLLEKTSRDSENTKDRLSLVACLLNENFAATQAGKASDYIFVERDWKVSRMPKYLDMNKDDLEWMMRFLNKEGAFAPLIPGSPRMPAPK